MKQVSRLLFAAGLAWMAMPPAQAEELTLTVENFYWYDLDEFLVAPNGSDWESSNSGDLLKGEVLEGGDWRDVVIEVDEDNCYYDILGMFADGSVVDDTDVPLCALVEIGSSYVFPDVPSHDEEDF